MLLTSWAIVHCPAVEGPGSLPGAALPGDHGRGPRATAGRTGPTDPAAYPDREYVDDAIAVLDATGTDRAVFVGLSLGGRHALQLAAWYPDRAAGVIAIGTALPWPVPPDFDEPEDCYEGWAEVQPALLAGRLPRLGRVLHVPGVHRAALDQAVGRTASAGGWRPTRRRCCCTGAGLDAPTVADAEAICRQVRCPVLVVHGDQDGIVPYETGVALAELDRRASWSRSGAAGTRRPCANRC